jgi:hypothetical protein
MASSFAVHPQYNCTSFLPSESKNLVRLLAAYEWEITTCTRIVTPLLYLWLDSFFYCPLNLLVTGTYRALAPHLGRVCTRVWTGCPATLPARCAFLFFILFLKNHLVLEELSYYAYLNPLLWNISETYSTAGLRLWVIEALQSTWSYGCYDPRVVLSAISVS